MFARIRAQILRTFGYDYDEHVTRMQDAEDTLSAGQDDIDEQQHALRRQRATTSQIHTITETGIWPQDMIRGSYKAGTRTVRRKVTRELR